MRRKCVSITLAVLLLFILCNVYFLFANNTSEWSEHFRQKVGEAHNTVQSVAFGISSKPTFLYNRGEHAPEYENGLKNITSTLNSLTEIPPGVDELQNYDRSILSDMHLIGAGEIPMTSKILSMYLQVSEEEKKVLKESHEKVMKTLPESVVENAFGGRGISMTGGGMYFPMALAAIRWIREEEPDIPIEVFMSNKDEYEQSYCEDIFPSLNVECLVGEEIYGEALSKKIMSAYALKPLAILASKFDDIYFMDVDSLPLLKVNSMFDSKIYQDTGYIMSRDYWSRYVSPHFYDIAGITLGGRERGSPECEALLQKDRKNAIPGPSSESGQLIVNKSKHIRSLILAMYYNMYGPKIYYPLLMMGGIGEGDKDTYAAAAVVCKEDYYQNTKGPATLGIFIDGSFNGYVMVQPNPVDDYAAHIEGDKSVVFRGAQAHTANFKTNIKYFFDNPKKKRGFPPLKPVRNYGNLKKVREETNVDVDVELKLFDAMRYAACEWAVKKGAVPNDWKGEDTKKYCRVLTAQVNFLRNNTEVRTDPLKAPQWVDLYAEGKVPELELSTE